MEMETRAREDIGIGQDITPPLSPLSFALHDLFLRSRCSACFSYVSAAAASTTTSPFVVYCSDECASDSSSLHFSSAEHHLFLHHRLSPWPHGDSTDLRVSLRLLRRLELLNLLPPLVPHLPGRIAGLMTNRDRLTSREVKPVDEDDLARIKDGGRVMAMARAMRDGKEFDGSCELEEAVMYIVLTNSVEVQIGEGRALGIAVYDGRFSWINHSCSPNAFYRFVLCSSMDLESSDCASKRIGPANQGIQIEDDSVYDVSDLAEECSKGPRLVVRSIGMMKKGDEVTITYTDLVQPTMLRQTDLWCKYRFLCNCIRCNGDLSYVDQSLQEILADCSSVRRDRFNEEMREYFDNVISELMSAGNNTNSCCEKIERMLIGDLINEQLYLVRPRALDLRLSPIHHLSLSAYTALSTGYKIQSGANYLSSSLKLSRLSTAYSLLLAGATHHLFMSEPSLIASAAKHWTNAGESLVYFAKNWPSPVNRSSPNFLSLSSLVCDNENCLLTNEIKADFSCSVSGHEELNQLSQHFLQCMTRIAPMVWKILSQSWYYLGQIEDPVDFSWLETLRTSNVWKGPTPSLYAQEADGLTDEVRMNIFLLGAHCLVCGCYLSGVCYGEDSSAADDARMILHVHK